jgi:hypothetical protein
MVWDNCPGCDPEFDPQYQQTSWCYMHGPLLHGSDDPYRSGDIVLPSGSMDMESRTNKAWCDLIHRNCLATVPRNQNKTEEG